MFLDAFTHALCYVTQDSNSTQTPEVRTSTLSAPTGLLDWINHTIEDGTKLSKLDGMLDGLLHGINEGAEDVVKLSTLDGMLDSFLDGINEGIEDGTKFVNLN